MFVVFVNLIYGWLAAPLPTLMISLFLQEISVPTQMTPHRNSTDSSKAMTYNILVSRPLKYHLTTYYYFIRLEFRSIKEHR